MKTKLSCFIGILYTCQIFGQPATTRSGVWNGTNSVGHVLHIIEDNRDLKRGPLLKGWIRKSNIHYPLFAASFKYDDNKFKASYLVGEKSNHVELTYQDGNEEFGIAHAVWDKETVTFYETGKTNN